MKLLLVEDNIALAKRIKQQLVELRFIVDVVYSGEDALEYVKTVAYSTIILDLGLPKMSGDDVCRKLRQSGVEAPILVLTGVGEVRSKVKLFDTGADDYVTKPFNSDELRARISALVRRQPLPRRHPLIRYRDISIDIDERKVYRNGVYIPLRRKEFDILEYMITNHGRVLTREMIVNHAWDTTSGNWNNSVDVHIKHLRDKIDKPFSIPYIKTAYGLGYTIDMPDTTIATSSQPTPLAIERAERS